ncbi:hypothetical protein ACFY2M_41050 [Streptomyces sp. NPDC001276]|uniref:hypothetical protein n=1 Tax=Streptomyces sp. NPDC001276 TaxID=3364555 RepID=UPI0036D0AB9D
MNSAAHHDRLLADLGLSIAATFTAICTTDEDDVIRCFGGDPAQARPGTLSDTKDGWDGEKQRIAVSRSGTTVVVVEGNQFQGSREEVLRPLSRLGRTASAFPCPFPSPRSRPLRDSCLGILLSRTSRTRTSSPSRLPRAAWTSASCVRTSKNCAGPGK